MCRDSTMTADHAGLSRAACGNLAYTHNTQAAQDPVPHNTPPSLTPDTAGALTATSTSRVA